MLDSIYHMTLRILKRSHFWRKNAIIMSSCMQRCYGRHNASRTSGLSKLFYGVISLPDATSYNKRRYSCSTHLRIKLYDHH